MNTFLEKNKVFLTGLAAAIALALQQFIGEPTVDWLAVGWAALLATLSFFASSWRGQGVTVLGIIGTASYTFVDLQNGHVFTWSKFILLTVAAVLAAVSSPPKPLGYEKTATIEQAKEQGKRITKASIIILLIGISLVMTSTTNAQSFFKAVPKPDMGKLKLGEATPLTMNSFRPSVNLASYSVPGNRLMTGVGVAYEHLAFDASTQKWNALWSINALAWYFAPIGNEDNTNGMVAYGIAGGFFNNLVLVGIATDGKYAFGTVGLGISLNN